MSRELTVTFPETSLAQGNQLAASLAAAVEQIDPGIDLRIAKVDPETQDLGSVLLIVVSSTAASAVASGIAAWIAKQGNPTVELKRPDGTSVLIKRSQPHTAEIVRAAFTDRE